MVTSRRARAGFTLIELVVTLAIIAILAAAGLPFAKSWMDGTRKLQAASNLIEAVGQARAIAMRNPHAQSGAALPLAAVVYDNANQLLSVMSSDGTTWSTVWSGHTASRGSSIKIQLQVIGTAGQVDLGCVAFNSRGIQVPASGVAGKTCQNPLGSGKQYEAVIGMGDNDSEAIHARPF